MDRQPQNRGGFHPGATSQTICAVKSEIWQRIQEICALRGYRTPGHLSVAAGLARTHLYRLSDPSAAEGVTVGTLARLAETAQVRLAWLVSGEGPIAAEESDCPSRDRAISAAALVLGSVPREILAEVCAMPADAKRSAHWWFAQIEARFFEEQAKAVEHV